MVVLLKYNFWQIRSGTTSLDSGNWWGGTEDQWTVTIFLNPKHIKSDEHVGDILYWEEELSLFKKAIKDYNKSPEAEDIINEDEILEKSEMNHYLIETDPMGWKRFPNHPENYVNDKTKYIEEVEEHGGEPQDLHETSCDEMRISNGN